MKIPAIKFNKTSAFAVLFASTLLLTFTGCDPDDPMVEKNYTNTRPESFLVGPEGASIKALDGNVEILIPAGALAEEVNLVVEEGPVDYDDEFIIKSIKISPKTFSFNLPAQIRLRYDSKLCLGKDICSSDRLAIYHFDTEAAFDKRNITDMVWIYQCCVNSNDQCIETKINGGGVFAIGRESLDITSHNGL